MTSSILSLISIASAIKYPTNRKIIILDMTDSIAMIKRDLTPVQYSTPKIINKHVIITRKNTVAIKQKIKKKKSNNTAHKRKIAYQNNTKQRQDSCRFCGHEIRKVKTNRGKWCTICTRTNEKPQLCDPLLCVKKN